MNILLLVLAVLGGLMLMLALTACTHGKLPLIQSDQQALIAFAVQARGKMVVAERSSNVSN